MKSTLGGGSKVEGRKEFIKLFFESGDAFPSTFHLPPSTYNRCYKFFLSYFLIITLHPLSAQACAVCFGNKDSLQTKGTMAGVLFLLIVIMAVLVGFAVTFIRWGLRERALQESLGPVSSEPGHS